MKKILIISIAMIMTMLAGFGVPYFMNKESRVDMGDRRAINNEVNNSGSDKNKNNSNSSKINKDSDTGNDPKSNNQSYFESNNINNKGNNGEKNSVINQNNNNNNSTNNNGRNNSSKNNNNNNNSNNNNSKNDNIVEPTPFPESNSTKTAFTTEAPSNNNNTELPYNIYIYQPTPIPVSNDTSSTKSTSRNKTIEERIQEHRAEILDEDLADFRRIFPKVDTSYLSRYDLSNITPEQFNELTTYLNNVLGSDLQRGLELYYKYNHFL